MALEDLTDEEVRKLYQENIERGSRAASEKSALETVGDIPEALAGMAVEGVKGLGSGAWGALTGEGEAYTGTMRRMEDIAKERLGNEVYENTVADIGDIITIAPAMAGMIWEAALRDDPYAAGGEIGQVLGEDAIGGLRWTAENLGKASKAFPLATLLSITGAGRVAGLSSRALARSAFKSDIKGAFNKAVPMADKITAAMEYEIPGTIGSRKKLVKDYEPGQIYNRAIGDEGLKLKDLMKPAALGAGTGLLLGVPEYGAMLGLMGKTGSGLLAKRGLFGKDVATTMAQLLRHTSAQAKVSDEVAVRSLQFDAPQAEASLNAASAMIADFIRDGGVLDGVADAAVLERISQDSGLKALVDVNTRFEPGPAGLMPTKLTVPKEKRLRAVNRLRLAPKLEEMLSTLEKDLHRLTDDQGGAASSTRLRLDDLLSGESAQFAMDPRVMNSVLNKIKELAPDIELSNLQAIGAMISDVARGPIFGNRDINPHFKLGDNVVNTRTLATEAWKGMKSKDQKDVLARVSTAIIAENKQIARGRASAKALDRESRRIFKGDDEAMARFRDLDGDAAVAVYGDNLMNSALLHGDAIPMVSLQGAPFERVAGYLGRKYLNPENLRAFLSERLGRNIDDADLSKTIGRVKDIVDELRDVDPQPVDLGKLGSDLARSVAADGLEGNRVVARIEALYNRGVIDDANLKALKEQLPDDFNVASATNIDARQIRRPLASTYGWLKNVDQSVGPNWANRIGAHVKSAYTILSPSSHANNMISNVGLLAMDRGIDPASVMVSAIVNNRRFKKWKERKKTGEEFSGREHLIFDKVSKMGFVEGDLITAEIRSLAGAGPGYGASPIVATNFAKAAREGGRTLSKIKEKAAAGYRWGDTTFKFDEAIRSMNEVYNFLDELDDGQYFDVPTSAATVTRIYKKNGELVVPKGRRSVADVVASNARMRANELFFDYSQRPGVLRWADKFGGATGFMNPYLTWYWKSLGIGGKGLLNRVNPFSPRYTTDNPSALRQMAAREFLKEGRRAVAINAMRSEFDRNPKDLAAVVKYAPDEARQILFMDLGDPNILAYRDVSNMNYLSPASTYFQFLGTALGKLTGSERSEFLDAAGETNMFKNLLELGGATGSPGLQIYNKAVDDRLKPEDWITPFLGVGATQSLIAGLGALGNWPNLSSFQRLKRLPENVRPTAEEYYFRRLTSVGWDRSHLFGRQSGRPGKVTKYFSQLKRNLKDNMVKPVLDDYRSGIVPGSEVVEALDKANEMYLRRIKEVQDSYQKIYPNYLFPDQVARLIKLRKTDL